MKQRLCLLTFLLLTMHSAWAANLDVITSSTGVDGSVTFSTSGSYEWKYSDGKLASSNKGIDSSTSETTITFYSKASWLSFDYGVSSESSYDKLTIILDGTTIVNAVSGEVNSSFKKFMNYGTHTLQLKYAKDSSQSNGSDQGYVSNLRINEGREDHWSMRNISYELDADGTLTIWGNGKITGSYEETDGYGFGIESYFPSEAKKVIIENGVTGIEEYAFYNLTKISSVTIPNSVTSIGREAFKGCSNLTSVTIPNNVTSIGELAFWNCSGLTSVIIGNNVTCIDKRAFEGCSSLTSINVLSNNPSYCSIDGVLFNKEVTSIMLYPVSKTGGFSIPGSVTSIGDAAFYGCSGLTSVTIPNSVTSIGSSAFYNCSGLTSVTIPNSVTSIGSSAFYNCSGLTSVTIPNSVNSIGNYAFGGCSGLTSVTIPNSVTSIDNSAFYNCSGLTSVTIPNSVTSIGGTAFYGCSGLTSVTIPNSVTSIGVSAFYRCSRLTSVTIPNSVTSIGTSAFSDCSGLTSVTIPNSVTSIGTSAFSGCSGLTSVTIPNGVTSIDSRVFYNCSGLTSVTIPNSVTNIGSYAFSGCSGLTSVTIPNSVTSIGGSAFSGCSGLTSVTIPNSVTFIDHYAFSGCSGLTSVTIGNKLTGISSNVFSGCSNVKELIYAEGCTTTLRTYLTSIETVTIPNSVTNIYNYAFNCPSLTSINVLCSNPIYCSIDGALFNKDMTSIKLYPAGKTGAYSIPDSVTSIGESAFKSCSSLTSVTIPNSVTSIGESAFRDCSGLTSVTIGNKLTGISSDVFSGCSNVKELIYAEGCTTTLRTYLTSVESVTIPNSVTSIGESAFKSCSSLTSVTIPNIVTSIGSSAFSGCSGLTSVAIPNSVTSIGSSAFSGCSGLTSVAIPNSVTRLGGSAFSYCSNLETISLGDKLRTIGTDAFGGCDAIKTIYCKAVVPPSCASGFSNEVYENAVLYVPNEKNAIIRYIGNDVWGQFFDVQEMDMHQLDDEIPDGSLPQVASVNLVDGMAYTNSEAKMVQELTYTRAFNNTNWQALFVPFQMSYEDWSGDFEVAAINMFHQYDDDEDGAFDRLEMEVRKVKSGTLRANYPYLIRAKSTGSKTLTLHNARLHAAGGSPMECNSMEMKYTFQGTYSGVSGEDMFTKGYYSMGGGTLHQAASSANNLVPYRWYLKMESRDGQVISTPSSVRVMLMGEDEITGIDDVELTPANAPVYDLQGRKVMKAVKGLSISNHKIILK